MRFMRGFPNEFFMLIGGFCSGPLKRSAEQSIIHIYHRREPKFCKVADFLQATRQ